MHNNLAQMEGNKADTHQKGKKKEFMADIK